MNKVSNISKSSAVKNSGWKLMESFLSKGISLIVSIVLARILAPEAYGIIALTTVFINLSDLLIQGGFSTALIRKSNVDDQDYSTVLGISLCSAAVLYALIFSVSPLLAEIYDKPDLTAILRVLCLTLFCQAFAAVRTAVVSREMKFKVLFKCTIIANLVSGILGIVAAYIGFGVWALVIQQLSQQAILTIVLMFSVKIKVRLRIYKKNLKELLPFSIKVLLSSLLSFAGDSLYSIVIGKVYSMQDLGYYDKGNQFPRQFSLYTFSPVSNVFLPVFASYKDDYTKLNEVFSRLINVSLYIILPLMMGLCMTGDSFIELLLTEKWLPCVPILRWSCLYFAVTPVFLAHVQMHFAIGKGGTRIKVEIIRLALMAISLGIMAFFHLDVVVIAACLAAIQIISTFVIMLATSRATKYTVTWCLKDNIKTIIITVIMGAAVFAVSQVNIGSVIIKFLIETVVGIVVYFGGSLLMKVPAFYEIKGMAAILLRKNKK